MCECLNCWKKIVLLLLTHILHWTQTGTEPASNVLTTRAKPLNNVGQFVTEFNVPTVLTQAQKLGVAAIKNNGNQIFYSISAFNFI